LTRTSAKQCFLPTLLVALAGSFSACNISETQVCNEAAGASCCPGNVLCIVSGSIYVTAGSQILHFSHNPSTGALTPEGSVSTTNPVGGVLAPSGSNFVYAVDRTQGAIVGYAANGSTLTAVPGSPFSGVDAQANPASDGSFLYMPIYSGGGLAVFSIGPQGSLTFLNPVPGVGQANTPFFATVVLLVPRFVYVSNVAATPGEIDASAVALNTGLISGVPNSPIQLAMSDGPTGAITQAGAKFIFVALPTANSVAAFSVDSASGALAPVPGSPFPTGKMPSALATDFTGTYLVVANEMDNTVSAFSIAANGSLSSLPGSPFSVGTSPSGVAFDNLQRLYVANSGSNNLSAFSINSTSGAVTPVPGSPFPAGTQPNAIAFSNVP
jgi:6-phosphogluconolactonase (cycloisomerase 2 family)